MRRLDVEWVDVNGPRLAIMLDQMAGGHGPHRATGVGVDRVRDE